MKKFYVRFTFLILSFSLLLGSVNAQTISTIAGTGVQGFSGENAAATIARLNSPAYVISNNAGNTYIADLLNHRIRKIDTDGFITTIAGTGGTEYNGDNIAATSAQLFNPTAIAFDQAGNLYVSDGNHNRIRKISISGVITTIAGTGTFGFNGDNIQATAAQLNYPTDGIVVDLSGNVYFSDTYNHRIRKISTSGIITTIAGTGTAGYNGDNINATVSQLNYPYGLAFDGTGNLYVADGRNHRIRKISTSGVISTVAGTGLQGYNGDNVSATAAALNTPQGIALDPSGNIFISDSYNHRIRKINSNTGVITSVTGTGTAGYNGDNITATLSQVNAPVGISFDAAGNLFIADIGNHRIRKVNNAGTILPLSLLKFTAQLKNNAGLLQWQTTNEINTERFMIEWSKDGTTFSALGSIKAKNVTGNNNYTFTDTRLANGINYYRLKMVDKDGQFTYSNVITVKVDAGTLSLNVYVNPNGQSANVSFISSIAGKYTMQITDLLGRVVRQVSGSAVAGINKLIVDISNYNTNAYILSINTAEHTKASIKFIK